MSWTDERVERLSKLWVEGRTASQIAAELGGGISRNAVIGKVHRLGLAGRASREAGTDVIRASTRPDVRAAPVASEPEVGVGARPRSETAPKPPVVPIARDIRDVIVPLSDRVTIMELREAMCRWPLGDPTSAEFRFCGCRSTPASPYCTAHARLAFQPMAERRRVERFARLA